MSVEVSVVIPTLNAGPSFGDLLERLLDQETPFGYEVLVIDSGSTDGTVDVSRIARGLGGGGHRQAAGASSELPLDELMATIRKGIQEQL